MEKVSANSPAEKIYLLFTNRVVYHVLFWIGLLLFLLTVEEGNHNFFFHLTNNLTNIFFYIVIVYFNLFYLIPNYLTQKKFLTYAILLVISAIIITPLKVLVLYFKFSSHPDLQQELIQNRNIYFLITFFIASTSTIFKIISDWVRDLREKQELQTQTMQSELRFLKSQINPHFLFNTLNNLYALTLKKSDKAPEIVIKLSEMMRYMLYECNEKQVMLSKEINYIRNYLDLEKLRQGKDIDIHFTVQGAVNDQKIAPLMFIPFLENSFKHGLNHQISQGFVNIVLDVDGPKIHFFIENSKPDAFNSPHIDSNRKSGGIGLVNVKRRLNILYPGKYDLKIDNNPKTYAVELDIDLMD